MNENRIRSHQENQDAIIAAILQGIPPDSGTVSQLGAAGLLEVFKQILVETSGEGRRRLVAIIKEDLGLVGDLAAEALGKWGGDEAGPILAEIQGDHLSRTRGKAVRRALHFHESMHGQTKVEPRKKAAREPATDQTGMMNAPDPFGTRVWIFRQAPDAEKPGRLAVVLTSETRGVRDFSWQEGDDSAFFRCQQRLADQGVRLVNVSYGYLCSRLFEAEQKNISGGDPLPPNYSVLRAWLKLESFENVKLDHPAKSSESIFEVTEPLAPHEVQGLLEFDETREWALPPDAFEGMLDQFKKAEQSQLVLDGLNPKQRVHRLLSTILERYLEGRERIVWALRLLDLAHVLNQTDRENAGKTAALIASDLQALNRSPVSDAFLWSLGGRTLEFLKRGIALNEPPEPGCEGSSQEHDGGGRIISP